MFKSVFAPRYLAHSVFRGQHAFITRGISSALAGSTDIRTKLTTELKAAMKSKDTMKSTTIRSVLAEVYAADKASGLAEPATSSAILSILRKAVLRRTDSAAEFEKASRPDLAQKEKSEAKLLEDFLPPLLPEAEIDRVLREVFSEQPHLASDPNSRKALGLVFKSFYAKIDRSSVDTDLVRRRAEALLADHQQ